MDYIWKSVNRATDSKSDVLQNTGIHLCSGSDFAVNVESSMPPGENLLHKGETDELFGKQKRENFIGKELLNKVIIEAADTVEGAI